MPFEGMSAFALQWLCQSGTSDRLPTEWAIIGSRLARSKTWKKRSSQEFLTLPLTDNESQCALTLTLFRVPMH